MPPRRVRYGELRPREYLTPKEVEQLIAAAKKRGKRFGLRDATMVLVTYRHGLRVAELCSLTWDQIDFGHGLLHVRRIASSPSGGQASPLLFAGASCRRRIRP
jgi:type 1 fimbriae regulatory protein FimB/type 1 fimbriae regulatory protein FimE